MKEKNIPSNLNNKHLVKIHKVIARRGILSNRKAEEYIKQGRVKIYGRIAQIGELVRDDIIIYIDSKKYSKNFKISNITYIMNKKIGDECSRNTFKNIHPSIFSRFSSKSSHFNLLKCVGRLDVLTSGLIIITTNSQIIQKIIHPSSNIKKTYIVGLDRKLDEKHKHKLLSIGIVIEHSISKPLSIIPLNYSNFNLRLKKQIGEQIGEQIREQIRFEQTNQKLFWYEVKVSEGKKHIIRTFFEYFRYRVKVLHRTKIGSLDLEQFDLKQGSYEKIEEEKLLGLIFNKKTNKKTNKKLDN
ncbi:MAG: pseudouridine synthase [Candidatus Woesearchaeota archaeon]